MQGASRHELIVVFLVWTLLGFFNFRLIYSISRQGDALLGIPYIRFDVSNPDVLLPTPYRQRRIRLSRTLRRRADHILSIPYWLPRVWKPIPA